MAYTPFQDGTQAFGIPDSPITIDGVTYIAEDIQINNPQNVAEIKNQDGTPTGQVLMPQVETGSAKLQLATAETAVPERNEDFELQEKTYIVENVGVSYTQGQYTYVNITFRARIVTPP